MAINHLALGCACAVAGMGGVGVGSKLLHDWLYPTGRTWSEPDSSMDFEGEDWNRAFLRPGMCIRKLFPDLIDSNFFVLKNQIKTKLRQAPTPVTVFDKDVPVAGKPAVGCMVMNVKKMIHSPQNDPATHYWRGAMRGELVLTTAKEGWIWIFGESTARAYMYKHVALKKVNGKWKVIAAVSGLTHSESTNLPGRSMFWNIDFQKDAKQECLDDAKRGMTNFKKCKAMPLVRTEEENWAGVWVENAGNQKFSGFVTNPTDVVFAWSPAGSKGRDYSEKLKNPQYRPEVYDGKKGEWYIDTTKEKVRPIVWRWNDDRRGLWMNIGDVCPNRRRMGANREYSDSLSVTFCGGR